MLRSTSIAPLGAALAFGACAGGGRDGTPPEFRVVTKAPLQVPPEYSLRPPQPGQVLPPEVDRQSSGRALTFGQDIGRNASPIEQLVIIRANAQAVNPVIRAEIDYQEAGVLRKGESITNDVLGWTGTEAELEEAARDTATGGAEVTIERRGGPRVKLPGT